MPRTIGLDVDEVLTTTRSVRKRLDLDRAVERDVILECLDLGLQAANGGNRQRWRWVVVDDAEQRRQVADIYRAAMHDHVNRVREPGEWRPDMTQPAMQRMATSVQYLNEHLHEVPVLVIPAMEGRIGATDRLFEQANLWGSILPAVWGFMLALRSRGLGSVWTTLHLLREAEMAELVGLPHDRYLQVGMFPVAYTLGTDFRRAPREPASAVVDWNHHTPA